MRIVIANDHGAIELKRQLLLWLKDQGHEFTDLGVNDASVSVDYPDMAESACAEFLKGGHDFGILLCGTGIGVSIAANKIAGIRCALVHDVFTATMAREHNDANFIALGGRIAYAIPPTTILKAFMYAKFQQGRHVHRLRKIQELEH